MFLDDDFEGPTNVCQAIPRFEHFQCLSPCFGNFAIELVQSASHLRSLCGKDNLLGSELTQELIESLVEIRKSLFADGSREIIVLELIVLFWPGHETIPENVSDTKFPTHVQCFVRFDFARISVAET